MQPLNMSAALDRLYQSIVAGKMLNDEQPWNMPEAFVTLRKVTSGHAVKLEQSKNIWVAFCRLPSLKFGTVTNEEQPRNIPRAFCRFRKSICWMDVSDEQP